MWGEKVIGQQINNVDALGDVGSRNLDKISKIVCKHRALTSENLEVFLDISHRELSLYDCTSTSSSLLLSWMDDADGTGRCQGE
jgi:DNA repair protein RAD7